MKPLHIPFDQAQTYREAQLIAGINWLVSMTLNYLDAEWAHNEIKEKFDELEIKYTYEQS